MLHLINVVLLVNRDIVLASNLKPLDKSDSIGQCFKQTWNINSSKADDTARSQNQNIEVRCVLTSSLCD